MCKGGAGQQNFPRSFAETPYNSSAGQEQARWPSTTKTTSKTQPNMRAHDTLRQEQHLFHPQALITCLKASRTSTSGWRNLSSASKCLYECNISLKYCQSQALLISALDTHRLLYYNDKFTHDALEKVNVLRSTGLTDMSSETLLMCIHRHVSDLCGTVCCFE